MDGDRDDLDLLLATTRQEVAELRSDRRLAPTQGSRGAALREHLLDLLDAFDHRISGAPDSSASPRVRRVFARSLRQSMVVLRGAYAALPWLAATRQPAVNLGCLYLTEELAVALVGSDVDLVVVPTAEAMYSTTSWPFSDVIEATPGFTPKTTRRPIVLNYPLSDGDRLLLHPLFAHELGHASVNEHNLLATVEARLYGEPSFDEAFQTAVTAMKPIWPRADEGSINRTLRTRLSPWVEELLCDHLATEVMGPAFLFAFAGFVMPLSYSEPYPLHPPATMRVDLMLKHLSQIGWDPYLKSVSPKIHGWLGVVASEASVASAPYLEIFKEQLLTHGDVIRQVARDRVGAHCLEPASATLAAKEAAELLEAVILPLGTDRPIDARAILLGGWQAGFKIHGDNPAGLVASIADRQLQDLVGKAAEMTTVVASW